MNTLKHLYRKLLRAFAYARFAWSNEDWDYTFLFELITFKLKRMQQAIYINGHHTPEKQSEQSLRLLIELSKKLVNCHYIYNYIKLEEKWGEPNWKKTGGFSLVDRTNIKTLADEQEYISDFNSACNKDEAMYSRDINWFFDILKKYHRHYWD